MPTISVTFCAEVPELGEHPGSLRWPMVEAWAVAMREEVPAAALAVSLEQVQGQLIDSVSGPRWLPVRGLPAPFACPGCGVMQDFARKGKRTRPRRIDTSRDRACAAGQCGLPGLRTGVRSAARSNLDRPAHRPAATRTCPSPRRPSR